MFGDTGVYATVAAAFAIAAVAFVGWSLADRRHRRIYGFAVATACLVMAAANALLAAEGVTTVSLDAVSHEEVRFAGYVVAFGIVAWTLASVAGASRIQTGLLVAVVCALPASTLAVSALSRSTDGVGQALAFVFLSVAVFLLVGPIGRAASEVSDHRRLLFGKLRTLSVFGWTVLAAVGLLSVESIGILDPFATIFLYSYLELLLLVGVGALLVGHSAALDDVDGRDSVGADTPEPAVVDDTPIEIEAS